MSRKYGSKVFTFSSCLLTCFIPWSSGLSEIEILDDGSIGTVHELCVTMGVSGVPTLLTFFFLFFSYLGRLYISIIILYF